MHDLEERRYIQYIMNRTELKNHPEYLEAYNKIKKYPKGFEFTIDYTKIPTPKANALRILFEECRKEKLIDCTSIYLALTGEATAETFVKL